jgi:hypothetical protein
MFEIDEIRFRRHPDHTPRVKVSEFDKWVGAHNIPETFEFGKGWWDYVELVRRFAARLNTDDVRVIGHYIVDTPPPCERLPMPAVAISIPGSLRLRQLVAEARGHQRMGRQRRSSVAVSRTALRTLR